MVWCLTGAVRYSTIFLTSNKDLHPIDIYRVLKLMPASQSTRMTAEAEIVVWTVHYITALQERSVW